MWQRCGWWHGNDDINTMCPIQNGSKLGQLFQWLTLFQTIQQYIKNWGHKIKNFYFQFSAHLLYYITTNDTHNFSKLHTIKNSFQARLHACFHLASQQIHNGTFNITQHHKQHIGTMTHIYFHLASKATMENALVWPRTQHTTSSPIGPFVLLCSDSCNFRILTWQTFYSS
jgi:hypothetical protein